jgi:23S rRNA pseudouridine2605 synthase
MRINKLLALATDLSRRAADTAVANGRVQINGQPAAVGSTVADGDQITLDGQLIQALPETQTIMLNKPAGYVCSRQGQGSKTIYDLLPVKLHHLKPVGRLDKDSSGLLLLTNDGELAHQLTHPSFQKEKIYEVTLDMELMPRDFEHITKRGVQLDDGPSKLGLDYINDDNFKWKVTMHEGRNRQIRRTFEKLGYTVIDLHRTQFGEYKLGGLSSGTVMSVRPRLHP